MKPLQHSIESERLARIINEKVKYYNKLYRQDPENQYLTILNSEITFLRDIIMPIVLQNTTVLYSGLCHHVVTAMREMEGRDDKERFCGVMLYYQTRQPNPGQIPFVAMASNVKTYNSIDFSMDIGGKYTVIQPVYPALAAQEENEWWNDVQKKLNDIRHNIDTSKLTPSTQKFVNPYNHG